MVRDQSVLFRCVVRGFIIHSELSSRVFIRDSMSNVQLVKGSSIMFC